MKNKQKFIPLNQSILLKESDGNSIIEEDGLIVESIENRNTIPIGLVEASLEEGVSSGDKVVYNPNNSVIFFLNGNKYFITHFSNLLGKIENEH